MTGYSERLTPEESSRRKKTMDKTMRFAVRLGFRTVAGKVGHFYHPDIDQGIVFDWSKLEGDPWTASDFLVAVYFRGMLEGQKHQSKKVKEALGL